MTRNPLPSPLAIPNIRRFVAFRIFFNARFYYPVFTILFVDFGLSLSQFALLNAVWAATIVALEVPSGALADLLGRRRLLVATSIIMVVEVLILCIVPRGRPELLFAVFVANRILSGAAEAAASGADEALAYDSLKALGREAEWGRVLEIQMRFQAAAHIVAMAIGAAVYDPVFMQRLAGWLNLPVVLEQADTLRLPLWLTLGMAAGALVATLGMTESPAAGDERAASLPLGRAFSLTLDAGRWILATPFALAVILCGMFFDHVLRMMVTLISQYYRLIQLPEASFGLIGAAMAGLGMVMPRVARVMAESLSPGVNLAVLGGLGFLALAAMVPAVPVLGLVPAAVLFAGMVLNGFFLSHYLNRIADSRRRATILSFRGLAFNLAYGAIGVFYALLLSHLGGSPDPAAGFSEAETVFALSLKWFPAYFLVGFLCVAGLARWLLGSRPFAGLDG